MCPFQRSPIEKKHLDFALVRKLVDQICMSKPYISLVGRGEPLLHPDFFELVSYVKSKGLWCAVDTNGTLIERNVDHLLKSRIDLVNVSIDSVGETQDSIRGVSGAFQKATGGIRALRAESRRFRPMLRINCVITGHSAGRLEEVYDTARELGVDMLNLCHSFYIRTEQMLRAQEKISQDLPQPREKISWDTVDVSAGKIDFEKLSQTIDKLRKKDEGVVVSVIPNLDTVDKLRRYYDFQGFVEKRNAQCAWKHTNVYPNGDVEMCDGLYPMGNLNEGDFLSIWNGDSFRKFRRQLQRLKRFPICSYCCRYYHYS
jgi:MoaA/NifB/PqqE/SkfB family radical SAM enzyme